MLGYEQAVTIFSWTCGRRGRGEGTPITLSSPEPYGGDVPIPRSQQLLWGVCTDSQVFDIMHRKGVTLADL